MAAARHMLNIFIIYFSSAILLRNKNITQFNTILCLGLILSKCFYLFITYQVVPRDIYFYWLQIVLLLLLVILHNTNKISNTLFGDMLI